MRRFRKLSSSWSATFLLVISAMYGAALAGQSPKPCAPLDSATTTSVAAYVAAKYHIGEAHDLSLTSLRVANDDCYWRFEYEQLSSRRDVAVYLTPDHRYLVPAIYDRATDPLAEERRERENTEQALVGIHSATRGPASAPVTIVEFSDFQCPYCQRLAILMEEQVLPNEPNVRVVFRNYPLSMHPWAEQAAQVIACAQIQSDGAFWRLHDYVFNNQKAFTAANVTEKLVAAADAEVSLNHDAFHQCVDEGFAVGRVNKDIELGKRFGVHATPTLFINGTKVEGVRDAAQLRELIVEAKAGTLKPSTAGGPVADQVGSVARRSAVTTAACIPTK
jgi:protein-disulfide isomerase